MQLATAKRCHGCGHVYRDATTDVSVCPACGVVEAPTIYVLVDREGNLVHPSIAERLYELGAVDPNLFSLLWRPPA